MVSDEPVLSLSSISAWCAMLGDLVSVVGRAESPQMVCRATRELVPYSFASAFVYRPRTAPLCIFDELPSEPIEYIDSPYLLDPVYNHYLNGTLPLACKLEDLLPDEFFKSEYWKTYYQHLDIRDEYCFNIQVDKRTIIHVPLTRCGTSLRFSEGELDLLSAISPLVASVMTTYWQARRDELAKRSESADLFHAHLSRTLTRFGRSLLTTREREVVRLTMRGFPDKLTATELGVTPGTVRNHKKSIFAKLRVTSQGQLFALFLEVLRLSEGDDSDSNLLENLVNQRKKAL